MTRVSSSVFPPVGLSEVPVFPLPRLVFFPGTHLPLHIFEPRYRAMMRDCLASTGKIMAVTLLKPGYESHYEGRPAIHEVCGLGRIEQYEELPDGRFNLTLRGIGRVRLVEHPAGEKPYRTAEATMLDSKEGADRVSRDAVTTLLSMASMVGARVRRQHLDFELGVTLDDPPHQIVDTIADRLLAEPEVRQTLLETLDVGTRLRLLSDQLATLLGQLEASGRPGARGTVQ